SLTFPEDTTAVHAAARLVAALVRFWEAMGYLREGRRWCERVLAMDVPLPAQVRAAVLNGAGQFSAILGELDPAEAAITAALAAYRTAGDARGIAESLMFLGAVAAQQGVPAVAAARFTESLAQFRAAGDDHGVARVLLNLGVLTERGVDHARAQAL